MPNAGAHLLPEAGATQERTLFAVACMPLFGSVLARRLLPIVLLPQSLPTVLTQRLR
jgi:hypothetical protein